MGRLTGMREGWMCMDAKSCWRGQWGAEYVSGFRVSKLCVWAVC